MSEVNKILLRLTGKRLQHWYSRIGVLIGDASKPIGSSGLESTDTEKWIGKLAVEIGRAVDVTLPVTHDENIAAARCMTLILGLWSTRIIRAKAYDPRRPLKARRAMMLSFAQQQRALLECVADESEDPRLFPAQSWDNPLAKDASYTPDELELKRQKFAASVSRGSK